MTESLNLSELNETELLDVNGGGAASDAGYIVGACIAEAWNATVYAAKWWFSR